MTIVATWNVNSIKARLPNALEWLGAASPDVVLLQELKCQDDGFPRLEIEGLGYHGNAVRYSDRGEFPRRAALRLDAELHGLRLPAQRDVAGRGLVPASSNSDERLSDLLLGHPHARRNK